MIVNSGKWPCGVCGKGVQANSVQCTVCKNGFTNGAVVLCDDLSQVANGFRCRRCDGTIQEVDLAEDLMVDGETYEYVKNFFYLGDTLDGGGGADFASTARIRNGWMMFRELLPFLTSRSSPIGDERASVCQLCQKQHDLGSETRPLLVDVGLKFERAEMQMIRWMCGISLKDKRTNEELRRLVGVEPITTFIRSGRLRWYGHVMRKGEEDWMKKCMEYKVEGRRPVGTPKKDMVRVCRSTMN